ncbi:hypothetical protein SPBR_04456 [Sporothrix brasiliensis 5110]|uniref:Uncharacterized protein n=1 Tax=Sporothrix brasiliensis 5110 TaxID=1398154 RepID=A0A0C2FQQ3_9PEZI|nr:uncharacterized protein SPBR_04456 [Sporothrix brasiliensis 5110]KIH93378.1 hypothetical protein SPBR_04456 [Sporothrix brasiliensis 5110]
MGNRKQDWTPSQVRHILKSLCLFDSQITMMLPIERRRSIYCTSFLSGSNAAQDLQPYQAQILQTGRYDGLFGFIDGLATIEAVAAVFETRWHYANLQSLVTKKGTIEFRCPPGSANAADATHWILWVLSFVYGALEKGRYGYGVMTRNRMSYNTYLEFIRAGHRAMPAVAKRGAVLINRHLANHGEGPSMTDRETRRFTREAKKLFSADR